MHTVCVYAAFISNISFTFSLSLSLSLSHTLHSCEAQQRYRGRADHKRHCCQYRHRLTAMNLTCLLIKPQQSMTTRERSRAVFAHFTAYTISSPLYPGMCSYLFHCVCFTIFVYEPLAGKSVQCIYTVI